MKKTAEEAAALEEQIGAEMDEVPVWRYGHVEEVETYFGEADYLLRTACDVAKIMGREAESCMPSEGDALDHIEVQKRMDSIVTLIEQYRQREKDFVSSINKKRRDGRKVA